MAKKKRKNLRTRGKIKLSRYFQELKQGDKVSVVAEKALQPRFPNRIQGKTGIIEAKRGNAFVIRINDQNKEKIFVIKPIHLKKINSSK